MKVVPWAAVVSGAVTLGLFVLVGLGKVPWSAAVAFATGSLVPALQVKS